MKKILCALILSFWLSIISANTNASESTKKLIPEKEINCLVFNAYHEANAEGKLGRLLVNQVVFNRTSDNQFCKTIYSRSQFSWTLSKQKRMAKIPIESYLELRKEVLELYYGFSKVPKQFSKITHFHTTAIVPYWSKSFKIAGRWKNHIFYQA